MFFFKGVYEGIFELKRDDAFSVLLNKMLVGGLSGSSTMLIVFPLDFARTRITANVMQKDQS